MSADPAPSADNRQAVDRDRVEAMLRAGIGRHYHSASLLNYGDVGQSMKSRMLGPLWKELDDGLCFIFHGKKSYEFSYVFARSLLLSGTTCRVTTPSKIAAMIEDRRWSEVEQIENARALVLLDFDGPDECPIGPWLRRRVEDILSGFLDNRRTLVFQSNGLAKGLPWWPAPFAARVEGRSERIEVR